MALLVAVLEKQEDVQLTGCDVFVNVAGGMRLSEPASDLGGVRRAGLVAPQPGGRPQDVLVLGEVGLAGEVRAVAQIEPRLAEAAQDGLRRARCCPRGAPAGSSREG